MLVNHYVGRLVTEITTEQFVKEVKDDFKKINPKGFDDVKAELKDGFLHVFCNGEVANFIRENKNVQGFRCDVIGESEFPSPANKKKKRRKKIR